MHKKPMLTDWLFFSLYKSLKAVVVAALTKCTVQPWKCQPTRQSRNYTLDLRNQIIGPTHTDVLSSVFRISFSAQLRSRSLIFTAWLLMAYPRHREEIKPGALWIMNQEKDNDGQSFLTPRLLLLPSPRLTILPLMRGCQHYRLEYWFKEGRRRERDRERERVDAGLPPGFVPVDT